MLHLRGLMAVQRYCAWVVLQKERGHGKVLYSHPKSYANFVCATIHCQKVETAHFLFFVIFWGINPFEILSISSADNISVKV